jgi:hypothetical protein
MSEDKAFEKMLRGIPGIKLSSRDDQRTVMEAWGVPLLETEFQISGTPEQPEGPAISAEYTITIRHEPQGAPLGGKLVLVLDANGHEWQQDISASILGRIVLGCLSRHSQDKAGQSHAASEEVSQMG